MASLDVSTVKFPSKDLAFENKVALFQADYERLDRPSHVLLTQKGWVYGVVPISEGMNTGEIGLTGPMRQELQAALRDRFTVKPYIPDDSRDRLYSITLSVDVAKVGARVDAIDGGQLAVDLQKILLGRVFNRGQSLLYDRFGTALMLQAVDMDTPNLDALKTGGDIDVGPSATKEAKMGLVFDRTQVVIKKASGSAIKLTNVASAGKSLMKKDFNLADLEIGGLDSEFDTIFRRAFASRIFPPDVLESLGINHIRGILLYGPPGCGKTLMARQIGKMLDAKEPKIVKGPEVLSKYVGESEKAIRELFADAEAEQAERGNESDLHIVIFDEIDAICKARGSHKDGTGVHDTIVNQLLSKMDGVDQLNNILIIGMTNRRDMLDQALLRPGRFECQLEISLPDEKGRRQVLDIHTRNMAKSGRLSSDVDLDGLASETKNFTGAELEGICKSASSHAMRRVIDPQALSKGVTAEQLKSLVVCAEDFDRAFSDIKPMFGVSEDDLEKKTPGGIISYGSRFEDNLDAGSRFCAQICREGSSTKVLSLLLQGPPGSGKTALAATLAREAGFPLVRLVSAEDYVGMGEHDKVMKIATVFDEAYKSPLSCIVIDNIERLVDYVAIGPRFSNSVLQALLVSLQKVPPRADRRIMILGTSSEPDLMAQMSVDKCFDTVLNIDELGEEAEVSAVIAASSIFAGGAAEEAQAAALTPLPISIKRLLLIIDLGLAGKSTMSIADYVEAISRFGLLPRAK